MNVQGAFSKLVKVTNQWSPTEMCTGTITLFEGMDSHLNMLASTYKGT